MSSTFARTPAFTRFRSARTACAPGSLNAQCMSEGLSDGENRLLARIVSYRRLARDESLFGMEQPFANLFVVRFGQFKTFRINLSGEQQVVGFQMTGDMMGMDAIGTQYHQSAAIALEDSEVCVFPFARLETLLVELPALQRHFHRLMSLEINREQNAMLSLQSMRAEQRFAIFLLNLSAHYAARGYSPSRFQLRMSRKDIGNYLGLTIESVSRVILRLNQKGWLRVVRREVEILDFVSVESLAKGLTRAEAIGSCRLQAEHHAALAMHFDLVSCLH